MKKIIIGLLILIPAVKFVSAQRHSDVVKHADIGIKVGYNAANFTNAAGSSYKMKDGFNAGLLAHFHINHNWAIQPELVYSTQGTNYNNSSSSYSLNYLNIPVLAQLMFGPGFRLETGPQLGFLTHAAAKTGNVSVKDNDSFNSTDFSWAFGLGYISPVKLGLDVRYNLGISDITKASSTVHNSVIQAGVFYQF